jgi:L-cysteine desulfidase
MLDISKLFHNEVKPALGCTEPVAIGYATSLAYNAILGRVPKWLKGRIPIKYVIDVQRDDIEIDRIEVSVDRGIFKNALAVGIPRSKGEKGIAIAAAMGIFCFPEAEGEEMALFETLRPEDFEHARALANRVNIKLIKGWERGEDIEIKASVEVKHKRPPARVLKGTAKIERAHSNVTSIDAYDSLGLVTGLPFQRKPDAQEEEPAVADGLKGMKISGMVAQLKTLPEDVTQKMLEMMEMNIAISEEGLRGTKGLGIGAALRDLVSQKYLSDDIITSAQIMVASAVDTRMGGFDYPVMSCAGSGNQGITASLPIIAVAQKHGYDVKGLLQKKRDGQISAKDEQSLGKLVKALALSNIITCYVTYHTKYLSALCGCAIKAGLGATAGIIYLLTESADKVEMAIQNIVGSATGLICDGGKEGCSLKLMAITSVAIQSALLAMKGIRVPSDNGIVAEKVEDTIQNIGRICQSMLATDVEVTHIMVDKSCLTLP